MSRQTRSSGFTLNPTEKCAKSRSGPIIHLDRPTDDIVNSSPSGSFFIQAQCCGRICSQRLQTEPVFFRSDPRCPERSSTSVTSTYWIASALLTRFGLVKVLDRRGLDQRAHGVGA